MDGMSDDPTGSRADLVIEQTPARPGVISVREPVHLHVTLNYSHVHPGTRYVPVRTVFVWLNPPEHVIHTNEHMAVCLISTNPAQKHGPARVFSSWVVYPEICHEVG